MLANITQEKLKKRLSYDAKTGKFIWRESTNSSIAIGSSAGSESVRGYTVIGIDGAGYRAHRLAWLYVHGEWPESEIDHINHIKSDNRIDNLRVVSRDENNRNRSKSKNNTWGVTGVYWRKDFNRWTASISSNNKQQHLGLFQDKFEAICARKSAEAKQGYHPNHGI